MNFVQLYDRYEETKKYKDRWLALYKDLYFYVIPDRDAFNVKFNYRDDGKPNTQLLWDNTAMLSAYQRANDLHGLLLPKDRVWGKLVMDPHIYSVEEIEQSQKDLDEMNDNIFFYLNESNLSRVISSSNLDLVGGTGAIWVESIDDNTPLYFRSIPAVTLYIEYSTDDLLNTCWYQMKMSGRVVEESFPNYRGLAYDAICGTPNELFTVIYGQIKNSDNSFYIYAVLELDPFTPLWERDSTYQQIIIYRDRVRPGESDGRGVGIDLLPTIRDLNRIVEYDRKSIAFKANPPVFYDADKYFNPHSIRQWAGAMIARNPQGRNPLEAFVLPTVPEVFNRIVDLREVIQKGFQVDPLGEIESPVKTATEISIRERRAQRTSATDISRLINEQPKQIFEVAAKILSERRLLTRDRAGYINPNGKKLKFDYQSPLYDIQKQEDLAHFMQNANIKQQLAGPGAAIATMNLTEVNKFLTHNLNLPQKLFKEDHEIEQFMQALLQQAQGMQGAGVEGNPEAPGVTI